MNNNESLIGTAVKTGMNWPRNEGIIIAAAGDTVTIEKYGRQVRDYVGGGVFSARLSECAFDAEVNEALSTISQLYREAAALRDARHAKGLRLETREEAELKREARRIQHNIDSL